tara:strand:- start:226 stop:645 length:420 start_codon:yes stop_codon:yes gene_type:complete
MQFIKLIFVIVLGTFLLASIACSSDQNSTSSSISDSQPVNAADATPEPTPTPELFTSSEFGKSSYITGLGGIDQNLLGSPSWMSYTDAKVFIKQFGLKTEPEFHIWAGTDKRPTDFPLRPPSVYIDEWTNWADFLESTD